MMTGEKNSVFELCSENTEKALRLYCDYINESDAELFIVMAQKAVCLFRYLLDEGLLEEDITYRYVSSSAIDFGSLELENKRIAIVDDIVISGSAISVTANNLISLGVKEENLEIIALTRNEEYQNIQFTRTITGENMLKCAMDAKDAESIEISYDISHILAYYGRQYDADFPLYDPVVVDESICRKLTKSLEWDVYDISNNIQILGNVKALVLFPKKIVLNEIWNSLGITLDEFVHLKVRMYFRTYASGKCVLQIVPMALFHETSETDIDLIFNHVANDILLEYSENWSYECKIRFLQFYLAHMVQEIIVNKSLPNKCTLSLEATSINFGFNCAEKIHHHLENIEKRENSVKIEKEFIEPDCLNYNDCFNHNLIIENNDEIGYEINQALYQMLKWWYITEELPARETLRKSNSHYYLDADFIKDCIIRLKQGFSLRVFESIVSNIEKVFQKEHLVSLFIDRGVDEGIVVPIIYYNENKHYLCRAYRHGEDLPFGEADKSRLLYFLKSLDECFRKDNGNVEEKIACVSFEKMIVLFYQWGLKQGNIFNRFLGFDNAPILQQRFCIHGIVAALDIITNENDKRHVYISTEEDNGGNSTSMITRIFQEQEYIELDNYRKRKNYIINIDKINGYFSSSELNNISDQIRDEISFIARVIEKWYWLETSYDGKDAFKDHISALTSCVDIYTFASSIATEIHYFKRYWEEEVKNHLQRVLQGEFVENWMSNSFHQAMPSARDKHNWHINHHATSAINRAEELFAMKNLESECRAWKNLWRQTRRTNLPGSEQLNELIKKALNFVYFYSACYEWLCHQGIYCNAKDLTGLKEECIDKFSANYEILSDDTNDFTVFDKVAVKRKLSKKVEFFINYIECLIEESEKVVAEIEVCLQEKSSTYTVLYNSVLVIGLKMSDEEKANELFGKVWSKLPENEDKTKTNIIALDSNSYGYRKYGVFHEQSGLEAVESLLNIYTQIHLLSCEYAIPTEATLIPCLPTTLQFKHNLRTNIAKHSAEFLEKFKRATSTIQYTNNLHQLWLMKIDSVPPEISDVVSRNLSNYGYSYVKSKTRGMYSRFELSFDLYVVGKAIEGNKLLCSTVKINIDGHSAGTGVMFSYKDKIYCISCQHLLDNCTEYSKIEGVDTIAQQPILMTPVNYKPLQSTRKSREAKEDILILKPSLEFHPDFDKHKFFCIEDCWNDADQERSIEEFTLFGFGKSDRELGHRRTNIKLSGQIAQGFMQMNSSGKYIEQGDSGAPIISNSSHKLFGIHVRSEKYQNNSTQDFLAIPIRYILDILSEI